MSNYKKKKFGLIFLSIGIGLIVLYFVGLKEKSKYDISKYILLALIVGSLFVIASVILLATIPSKRSIYEKGKKGCCTILKVDTSHSSGGRGCSFYFLVEYKAEDGSIARDCVKCSIEEINTYKIGTVLLCYISERNVYVPRPFKVIENDSLDSFR